MLTLKESANHFHPRLCILRVVKFDTCADFSFVLICIKSLLTDYHEEGILQCRLYISVTTRVRICQLPNCSRGFFVQFKARRYICPALKSRRPINHYSTFWPVKAVNSSECHYQPQYFSFSTHLQISSRYKSPLLHPLHRTFKIPAPRTTSSKT